MEPPNIYCPPELEDPLKRMVAIWSEIEHFEIACNIVGVDYDTLYPLKGEFYFRPIRSIHRVPSNGYCIIEKKQKLKNEYINLPGHKIAEKKNQGEDLFYSMEAPIVTFSGDTKIEFVLENEMARNSKVLFLECTYIDEKRPVERARQWGHVHLFEIRDHAEAFRNIEKLFLIHFSPRYRASAIKEAIREVLPDWLADKTVPFLTTRSEIDR